MKCYATREKPVSPPISEVCVVMSLGEAIRLQWAITSAVPDVVKDRVRDALTSTFRAEGIEGPALV